MAHDSDQESAPETDAPSGSESKSRSSSGETALARLTHVALRTTDMDASVDFYRRYAGFRIAHSRKEDGIRVIWLAERVEDPSFVIVLLEMPHSAAPEPGPNDHLGFAVESRQQVDRIAALARREGRLKLEARYVGEIPGYLTLIRDPSGNTCEFSYGQKLRAPPEEAS